MTKCVASSSLATHQTLRQQGETGEDGHWHSSCRLDFQCSGDREEEEEEEERTFQNDHAKIWQFSSVPFDLQLRKAASSACNVWNLWPLFLSKVGHTNHTMRRGSKQRRRPPCGRQPERAVMRRANQAWKKEPVAATLYHSCVGFSLRTSSQTSGKTMLNESNSWGNWPLEAIWTRTRLRELVNSLVCSLPSPSKFSCCSF